MWLFATNNALLAQNMAVNRPDSMRTLRQAEAVVQNAPLIFKAKTIQVKGTRGANNDVIQVRQLCIIDVIKGNLKINDTIEKDKSVQ